MELEESSYMLQTSPVWCSYFKAKIKIVIVWSNLYVYILVCKIMYMFCVHPVSKSNYTIYSQMCTVSVIQ